MFKKKAGPVKETLFKEQGYLVRFVQVIGLGLQARNHYQTHEAMEPQYEVMFTFEFSELRNDKDEPLWLSKRVPFPLAWPEKTGLHVKSGMYKIFAAAKPELLTQADKWPDYWFYDDSIFEALLGEPCYVQVKMTETGKPKVVSIDKVPAFGGKLLDVPALENPTMLFDAEEATLEEYKALWPWIRDILGEALDDETLNAANALASQLKAESDARAAEMASAPEEDTEVPGGPDEPLDDDLPF